MEFNEEIKLMFKELLRETKNETLFHSKKEGYKMDEKVPTCWMKDETIINVYFSEVIMTLEGRLFNIRIEEDCIEIADKKSKKEYNSNVIVRL